MIDVLRRTLRQITRIGATVRAWVAPYWPGRRTAWWTVGMVALFVLAGASVADADDGSERGGILAPLNVMSSEGVPLDNYNLDSADGGPTDIRSHICKLLITAIFSMVRLVVGLMCMVLKWVYEFPIVSALVNTADRVGWYLGLNARYDLKLSLLFVTGAFALGVWWIMRGKVAKGAGEILLTLVIGGLMVLPTLTPRAILGPEGPVAQVSAAATEAGTIVTDAGGDQQGCTSDADKKDPSCPMRVMLTRTLVVQPFQLLQYGVIPDPHSENANIRGLADVHNRWIHGEIKDNKGCGISWLGGDQLCRQTAWQKLLTELDKYGDEGQMAKNFAVNSNWDRVFGALLVLLTALMIAAVILSMCFVHLGTQFADVGAATMTPVALIWAQLPGSNRAALWKWLGTFMASAAVAFAVSMMLPAFGIAVNAIMTDQHNTVMVQRMLLMCAIGLVLLVFHRRLLASASRLGDRFAERMKYAKIGGSAGLGEDSSRLGMAMSHVMSNMGYGAGGSAMVPSGGLGMAGGGAVGGGGGFGALGSQSPVHAAMLRRAQIQSGLASMAGSDLGPMNAAGMAAGAFGEFRRGMHQLATPLRIAHHAVVGNPLPEHVMARRRKPVNNGSGHMLINGHTGEIMHDPSKPTPWGHLLHNQLLTTRAGRLAIRAGQLGRLGYDLSPLGLGATVTRVRNGAGHVVGAVHDQWEHYREEFSQHLDDQREGWEAMDAPFRVASEGAGWAYEHGKTAATNAATAAAFYASPSTASDSAGLGVPAVRVVDVPGDALGDGADGDWMPSTPIGREAGSWGDVSATLGPGAFPDEVPAADTEVLPATSVVESAPASAPPAPSGPPASEDAAPKRPRGGAAPGPGGRDIAAEALRARIADATARAGEDLVWDGMFSGYADGGDAPGFEPSFDPGDLL
ncbi:hypothetical protein [Streptomyces sp. NRRL B-24484]|uniref:hypothetical protein n=1 Tax=Streptomyces sp. NRRL B-24484 TaxID=1463833 RepID=UPI0004BF7355|nr:hypothetical protein [Streptomyces sp. NRRL B-24484]